ncbi:hypothetical protein HUA76_43705 [Myxococcus sp. CA056]|nr:hypothetical protein [Myxococcus sp. CA056]NTX17688.1 hypothetical protein [Myxococcus sp. CA056]
MARPRPKCLNCGAPFLKAVEREPLCTHCGAERTKPTGIPLQPGWKEVPSAQQEAAKRNHAAMVVAGIFSVFMLLGGVGVAFLVYATEPIPARVTERPRPPPPTITPPPIPRPPEPPPIVTQPPLPPMVEKPIKRPPLPKTNEAWGAVMLSKHLRDYDYCGREAILRDGGIPRIFRLRARFDANGEGVKGKVTPVTSVKMLDACITNRTKYIYLGKPPEKREFAVEMTLSFAHLRPKGKPETRDDQWSDLSGD